MAGLNRLSHGLRRIKNANTDEIILGILGAGGASGWAAGLVLPLVPVFSAVFVGIAVLVISLSATLLAACRFADKADKAEKIDMELVDLRATCAELKGTAEDAPAAPVMHLRNAVAPGTDALPRDVTNMAARHAAVPA